jgi:hypothetical protein
MTKAAGFRALRMSSDIKDAVVEGGQWLAPARVWRALGKVVVIDLISGMSVRTVSPPFRCSAGSGMECVGQKTNRLQRKGSGGAMTGSSPIRSGGLEEKETMARRRGGDKDRRN